MATPAPEPARVARFVIRFPLDHPPELGGPAMAPHAFHQLRRSSGGVEHRVLRALHGRVDASQVRMLAEGWIQLLDAGVAPYVEGQPPEG